MSKIIRNNRKRFSKMERGQVLVLVALSAVIIIAIIGLTIDVGLMFIGNARLRRAVDAAALSAALQYRQNADLGDLTRSAKEFLPLNGMTVETVTVDNCTTDNTLCSTPRKLVRVHATARVKLAFLPIIGIDTIPISASAVSEAASLDVILVLDRSESMTFGDKDGKHDISDPMRDPSYCNGISFTDRYGVSHTSSCQPFDSVTTAAIGFAESLFYPYDYVSVVTFDKEPHLNLSLVDSDTGEGHTETEVINAIKGLTVYEGENSFNNATSTTEDYRCYGNTSACTGPTNSLSSISGDICTDEPIMGSGSNYQGLIGKTQDPCVPGTFTYDPTDNFQTNYTTTNIGGGLEMAGNQLATDSRQQTLWVVILLTDGVANAGHSDTGLTIYCPKSTWLNVPVCNDKGVAGDANPSLRPAKDSGDYDASDYAYAMADFVGKDYPDGQGALLYTIGLGDELTKYTTYTPSNYVDPYNTDFADYPSSTGEGLGMIFLNYAAHVGNGQAFYTKKASELNKIFQLIGSNIATRLTQ